MGGLSHHRNIKRPSGLYTHSAFPRSAGPNSSSSDMTNYINHERIQPRSELCPLVFPSPLTRMGGIRIKGGIIGSIIRNNNYNMKQRQQVSETKRYCIYVLHKAHAHVSSCVIPRFPLSKRKPNQGPAHLVLQVNICTVHQQELSELQRSPFSDAALCSGIARSLSCRPIRCLVR